jgi:lipid-binding SYLF domain-containing protein
MKTLILGLTILGFISPVLAVDRPDLDNRIHLLTAKFEAMQQKPDERIPADVLSRASGIVLLDRTKAGLGFAYQGGSGVALVKDERGHWGPAAFLSANEVSFGPQIGGEQNFSVMVFMNQDSVRDLAGTTMEFGGTARGTIGNTSGGADGTVTAPKLYDVLVYSDRSGFYNGLSVKNGGIVPDNRANVVYYGQPVTMTDILFGHKVNTTPAATSLAGEISAYSRQQ